MQYTIVCGDVTWYNTSPAPHLWPTVHRIQVMVEILLYMSCGPAAAIITHNILFFHQGPRCALTVLAALIGLGSYSFTWSCRYIFKVWRRQHNRRLLVSSPEPRLPHHPKLAEPTKVLNWIISHCVRRLGQLNAEQSWTTLPFLMVCWMGSF